MSDRAYPTERIARYVSALNGADTYAQLSTPADRERLARAVMAVADAETDPVYKSGYDTGRAHAGADRARVLREVDERFSAMELPEHLQGTLNAGSYADAWRHCRAIVQTMAEEKSSRAPADATPDFFRAGQVYTEPDGSTDWKFRCDSITTRPGTGERTALGWRHFRGEWEPCAYGEGDWEIHQIADSIATTQGDSK